jgi:hypothetical protein
VSAVTQVFSGPSCHLWAHEAVLGECRLDARWPVDDRHRAAVPVPTAAECEALEAGFKALGIRDLPTSAAGAASWYKGLPAVPLPLALGGAGGLGLLLGSLGRVDLPVLAQPFDGRVGSGGDHAEIVCVVDQPVEALTRQN